MVIHILLHSNTTTKQVHWLKSQASFFNQHYNNRAGLGSRFRWFRTNLHFGSAYGSRTHRPNPHSPRSAPVKLDAPPPSRSAQHKLDLQPQYGIRPTIAHRPNPHSPQSTFAPDPPQLIGRTAPFQIRPTQIGLTAPIRDSPHYRLDAPPPSRSAPHKLDLYGIRPTIAWTHHPLPDPPHTNWTYSPNTGFAPLSLGRTAPFQIRPTQIGLTAPIRDSPWYTEC